MLGTFILSFFMVSNSEILKQHSDRVVAFSAAELQQAEKYRMEARVAMTINETALLVRHISSANKYFEFGSGGSTQVACMIGKPALEMWSVDSSASFLQSVMDRSCLKTMDPNRVHVISVDIGPTGVWGYPNSTNTHDLNKRTRYSLKVAGIKAALDVIRIDGRFRIACAFQAMLTHPKAAILVHDFFSESHYPSYKILLNVSRIVEAAGTLVRLERKTEISDEELNNWWRSYHSNPS